MKNWKELSNEVEIFKIPEKQRLRKNRKLGKHIPRTRLTANETSEPHIIVHITHQNLDFWNDGKALVKQRNKNVSKLIVAAKIR